MVNSEPLDVRFALPSADFAASVVENFAWVAELNRSAGTAVIECRLAADLSLFVAYRLGGMNLGVRFARPDINPTSGLPASSARQQASFFFHSLHDAPETPEYTDGAGYGWWGDRPDGGWKLGLRDRVQEIPRE